MRFRYLLTVLVILTNAPTLAQEPQPVAPPTANDWTGPVVGGRHRQPTQPEIQQRQQAEGQSAKAIQQRNRGEDKTIDDLYKELMTPVPSGERSGETGQAPR